MTSKARAAELHRAWYLKPENRAKKIAYRKAWEAAHPEVVLARSKAKQKKLRLNPDTNIPLRIRDRLRQAVDNPGPRRLDKAGAEFLLWCRPQNISDWHIDHLYPLASQEGRQLQNDPLNVRWLPAQENLLKGSRPPTQEEIDEHSLLVSAYDSSR